MKKKILFAMWCMMLAIIVPVTFSSCGGDDDDDAQGETTDGGGNSSSTSGRTYIEPYINWTASIDEWETKMAASGWEKTVGDARFGQYDNKKHPNIVINNFELAIYKYINVLYLSSSKVTREDVEWYKNETEKRYGITLEKDLDNTYEDRYSTSGAIINGQKTSVSVTYLYDTNLITVCFEH